MFSMSVVVANGVNVVKLVGFLTATIFDFWSWTFGSWKLPPTGGMAGQGTKVQLFRLFLRLAQASRSAKISTFGVN